MKQLLAILALTVATAAWTLAADEVELTGKLGCGHCEFHKTKSCAAAFKTKDGKTYVIANATKEITDARFDGGTVKVTGTVTEKDGLLTVQASKQELTK
jgi:hypothetical protein